MPLSSSLVLSPGALTLLPWFDVPSHGSRDGTGLPAHAQSRATKSCERQRLSQAGQTLVVHHRTSALARAAMQAHAGSPERAPCFPHTLTLVRCGSGLLLMFPGQMWQGTVKGQLLNEPLWDLPQFLTISLQLIRQGVAALAVSLHHFPPLPFPPEPPARSAQTNQLSIKIQMGSFSLESSFSPALTPAFRYVQQPAGRSASPGSGSDCTCPITYSQLSTWFHTQTWHELAHKTQHPHARTALCVCALTKGQERALGSFINSRISLFQLEVTLPECVSGKNAP